MSKQKAKVFHEGTFRESLLAYSKDRMQSDKPYRRDVLVMLKAKRNARKARAVEAVAASA